MVDNINGLCEVGSLQSGIEVGFEDGVIVDTEVEVIALDRLGLEFRVGKVDELMEFLFNFLWGIVHCCFIIIKELNMLS